MSSSLTVKTVFTLPSTGEADVRRFTLSSSSSDLYLLLSSYLVTAYQDEVDLSISRFFLSFVDPEGDLCSIGRESELMEAVRCSAPSIVKIVVKVAPLFSSRPSSGASVVPLPSFSSSLSASASAALAALDEEKDKDSDSEDEFVKIDGEDDQKEKEKDKKNDKKSEALSFKRSSSHRSISSSPLPDILVAEPETDGEFFEVGGRNEVSPSSSSLSPSEAPLLAAATSSAPKNKPGSDNSSYPSTWTALSLETSSPSSLSTSSLSAPVQPEQEKQKEEKTAEPIEQIAPSSVVTVEDVTHQERDEDEFVHAILDSLTLSSSLPQPIRHFPSPTASASTSSATIVPVSISVSNKTEKDEKKGPEEQKENEGVHYNFICDGCGAAPIKGHRYRCIICTDLDLCSSCEAQRKEPMKHDHTHTMRKIPAPGRFSSYVPASSPSSSSISTTSTGPVVHAEVCCDGCSLFPLVGDRYKCTQCFNYDLCSACEAKDEHDKTHTLLKIREPISSSSSASSRDEQREMWRSIKREWRQRHGHGHHGYGHGEGDRGEWRRERGEAEQRGHCGRWRGMRAHHAHGHHAPEISSSSCCPSSFSSSDRPQATFVADVTYQDGAIVSPGASVKKVWSVTNSGTQPWPTNTRLVLIHGADLLSASLSSSSSAAATPLVHSSTSVAVPAAQPGETVHIAIDLVAPTEEGRYKSKFLLVADEHRFGPKMWIDLNVKKVVREEREEKKENFPFQPEGPSCSSSPSASSQAKEALRGAVQTILQSVGALGQNAASGSILDLLSRLQPPLASPAPSSNATASQFVEEFEAIRNMGFTSDRALIERLLIRYNGDISRTINELLAQLQ